MVRVNLWGCLIILISLGQPELGLIIVNSIWLSLIEVNFPSPESLDAASWVNPQINHKSQFMGMFPEMYSLNSIKKAQLGLISFNLH